MSIGTALGGLGFGPALVSELLALIPRGGRRKFVKLMLIMISGQIGAIAGLTEDEDRKAWLHGIRDVLLVLGEILKESEQEGD